MCVCVCVYVCVCICPYLYDLEDFECFFVGEVFDGDAEVAHFFVGQGLVLVEAVCVRVCVCVCVCVLVR